MSKKDFFQNNDIVLFLGAGFDMNFGMPNSIELVRIVGRLIETYVDKNINSVRGQIQLIINNNNFSDQRKIELLIYTVGLSNINCSEEDFFNKIGSSLRTILDLNRNQVHPKTLEQLDIFKKMIKTSYNIRVATTNYSNVLISDEYEIKTVNIKNLQTELNFIQGDVAALHGTLFIDDKCSVREIIISERDYSNKNYSKIIDIFNKNFLKSSNTIIFFGYSLNDANILENIIFNSSVKKIIYFFVYTDETWKSLLMTHWVNFFKNLVPDIVCEPIPIKANSDIDYTNVLFEFIDYVIKLNDEIIPSQPEELTVDQAISKINSIPSTELYRVRNYYLDVSGTKDSALLKGIVQRICDLLEENFSEKFFIFIEGSTREKWFSEISSKVTELTLKYLKNLLDNQIFLRDIYTKFLTIKEQQKVYLQLDDKSNFLYQFHLMNYDNNDLIFEQFYHNDEVVFSLFELALNNKFHNLGYRDEYDESVYLTLYNGIVNIPKKEILKIKNIKQLSKDFEKVCENSNDSSGLVDFVLKIIKGTLIKMNLLSSEHKYINFSNTKEWLLANIFTPTFILHYNKKTEILKLAEENKMIGYISEKEWIFDKSKFPRETHGVWSTIRSVGDKDFLKNIHYSTCDKTDWKCILKIFISVDNNSWYGDNVTKLVLKHASCTEILNFLTENKNDSISANISSCLYNLSKHKENFALIVDFIRINSYVYLSSDIAFRFKEEKLKPQENDIEYIIKYLTNTNYIYENNHFFINSLYGRLFEWLISPTIINNSYTDLSKEYIKKICFSPDNPCSYFFEAMKMKFGIPFTLPTEKSDYYTFLCGFFNNFSVWSIPLSNNIIDAFINSEQRFLDRENRNETSHKIDGYMFRILLCENSDEINSIDYLKFFNWVKRNNLVQDNLLYEYFTSNMRKKILLEVKQQFETIFNEDITTFIFQRLRYINRKNNKSSEDGEGKYNLELVDSLITKATSTPPLKAWDLPDTLEFLIAREYDDNVICKILMRLQKPESNNLVQSIHDNKKVLFNYLQGLKKRNPKLYTNFIDLTDKLGIPFTNKEFLK